MNTDTRQTVPTTGASAYMDGLATFLRRQQHHHRPIPPVVVGRLVSVSPERGVFNLPCEFRARTRQKQARARACIRQRSNQSKPCTEPSTGPKSLRPHLCLQAHERHFQADLKLGLYRCNSYKLTNVITTKLTKYRPRLHKVDHTTHAAVRDRSRLNTRPRATSRTHA